MTYADEFKEFIDTRIGFFNGVKNTAEAEQFAQHQTYRFLANNKKLIEQEFNQLFSVLQAEAEKNAANEKFYLWCYCCCLMMANYFEHYHNKAAADKQRDKFLKSEEYKKLCADLEILIKAEDLDGDEFEDLDGGNPKKSKAAKASFFKQLQQKLSNDLNYILSIPMQTTNLKDWIGFLNVCRIYWAFCRLMLVHTFTLSKGTVLLTKLNTLLNKQIDIDKIIHSMNAPAEIFRALSVGFFVMRFMINAGLILKHTLAASAVESDELTGLTMMERFSSEVWKRHPKMINDIVWMTVNALCNYNSRFGISDTAAGGITALFLVFDIAMILYCRQNAKQEYLLKLAQYKKDRKFFAKADNLLSVLMIDKQIVELGIEWAATSETYLFNATGAFLLGLGFTASMLLTTPIAMVGCYFVCMIGVAVYLSDEAYSKYAEANARYEQALTAGVQGKALADLESKLIETRDNLMWTLLKNALLPSFTIIAYAICWEAALLLTISILAYQFINATLETTVAEAALPELAVDAPAPVELNPIEEEEEEENILLEDNKSQEPKPSMWDYVSSLFSSKSKPTNKASQSVFVPEEPKNNWRS